MEQHIRKEEWFYLFNPELSVPEGTKKKNHLLAHISICPECRAIFEKGRNLQVSLRRYSAIKDQSATSLWGSEYQAVASPQQGDAEEAKASGYLSIDIEIQNNSAVFLEETLETTGCANKYALNAVDHGQRMEDDGNALTLEADNGRIRILFSDGDAQIEAKLITEEAIIPLHFSENVAESPLPAADYCTLDMIFHA